MMTPQTELVDLMRSVSHTILEHSVADGLKLWRLGMNRHRNCAQTCAFGPDINTKTCAHCLEGRLRTFNLYKQIGPETDCPFRNAANALRTWTTPGLGADLA